MRKRLIFISFSINSRDDLNCYSALSLIHKMQNVLIISLFFLYAFDYMYKTHL